MTHTSDTSLFTLPPPRADSMSSTTFPRILENLSTRLLISFISLYYIMNGIAYYLGRFDPDSAVRPRVQASFRWSMGMGSFQVAMEK